MVLLLPGGVNVEYKNILESRRIEIANSAVFHYLDNDYTVAVDLNEGTKQGSWAHPETDAPAFVRKALGIKYVHPNESKPLPKTMRICDWFNRGK